MNEFLMGPIPPGEKLPSGKNRGWKVLIDGVEQKVGLIKLISQYGDLTYGLRPEGYDAWVFEETGGAITIPYCVTDNGEVLVGLLSENRPNMGGNVLCAIGGFTDFGETADQTQARETVEETGLELKAKKLDGLFLNPNRAFFVADCWDAKGVACFCAKIPSNLLVRDQDKNCFVFDNSENVAFKKASKVYFYSWREAIRITPDALAVALIGRLVATIL
jgi:ADP-ribose pyrophosphatase YjhB (NUDIX family)